jgi:hypothetical protein
MRDQVLKIAMGEVGYKESPANSNLTKYGEWYGVNGKKWCALFISWVYDQAGFKWPKQLDSPKGFIWVPVIIYRSKQFPQLYTRTFDPLPGDIVVFDWEGDKEPDHVALFVKWIVKGKTFETIEGNTSKGNNSNGGQVQYRKDRSMANVLCFVQAIKEK